MVNATFSRTATALLSIVLSAAPAAAQPGAAAAPRGPNDLAALADQLARLEQEVAALRATLAELQSAAAPPAAATQQPPTQVTPDMYDVLKSQVEEQAQAKVESASRFPVKLSGTILTNTYVNSGEANWLENPNLVGAPPSGGAPAGSMSATARQSRIGVEVTAIPIGSWQASGTLIADFFGGVPNFQTGTVMGLPRLMYAFGRLQRNDTVIQIGQDHTILAPRDPTSLAAFSFPLFFRAGNLYLRAPQARVEQTFASHWTVAGGIVAPIAGDFTTPYEFAPSAGSGERSRRPAVEGRLAYQHGDDTAPAELSVGVAAHTAWRRSGSSLEDAWAVAVDFNARVRRAGAAGEYYRARNAEPFGGGISQPGRSSGGWIEGRFSVTPRTRLAGGFGIDSPDDAVGRLLRTENRSGFGNVIVDLTPEVSASVEYRWLQTRAGLQAVARENHHVNGVFAVRF